MKTIFVPSFHPIISRNILSTPTLSYLLEDQNIRVVVLCYEHKKSFFEKEYGRDRIIIEGVKKRLIKSDRFMRTISFAALHTRSMEIKQVVEMNGRGSILKLLLRGSFGVWVIRLIFQLITKENFYIDIFEKYKPDLIFSTDIQNPEDLRLLLRAKRSGIKTISMVRSWDNLLSKGIICFVPDVLVVHNNLLKQQAIDIHKIRPSIIRVVGIPHYDSYYSAISRDINHHAKKRVLYTPVGDRYVKNNNVDIDIVEILNDRLPNDYEIFVRLPFSDSVRGLDDRISSGRIIYDRPSKKFEMLRNNELSNADETHLIETLHNSDVVVTGPSTIVIDASFFDKPVILINFDGKKQKAFYESVKRFYEYDHFAPIKESGGVSFVSNEQELINEIINYAENPARNTNGRRKIIEMECYKKDGLSSKRLAQVIKNNLQ